MRSQARDDGHSLLTLLALGTASYLTLRAAVHASRRIDLRGKVVLITGGSRGLGLVMARQFAAKGAKVVIAARDENEVRDAAQDLRGRGADVLPLTADLLDAAQVEGMVRQASDHFGPIDVLVNNAGTIQVGPIDSMTPADYEEAMKLHFWAPFWAVQAVLPQMRARGAGRIVNISSIGGKVSVPHLLPYSTSKFALVGFSEGLRSELMREGIYVTTVCPGLMRTGSHVNATFKGQNRLEYTLFSIGNSLPFSSTNAESAARQIVEACRYGDAELVIGLPAQAADLVHAMFPGATADLLGAGNRLLPGPGGIGTERAAGKESQTPLSPSPLTALADRAVNRNNEF